MKKYITLIIVIIFILSIGCTKTNDADVDNEAVNNGSAVIESEAENATETNVETTDEQSDDEVKKAQIAVDALNVRENADIESEKIGSVFLGSVFEVLEEKTVDSEVWYKISYEDGFGWIAGWFCDETDLDVVTFDRDECPRLNISKYYYMNDVIIYNSIKNKDYEIYLNDELVDSNINLTETGKHELHVKIGDKQSPNYEFSVVSSDTQMVFGAPSYDSEIIGVKMKSNKADRIYKAGYLTQSDDLEFWAEVVVNDETGYIMIGDKEVASYSVDALYVLANGKNTEFSVPNSLVTIEHVKDTYYQITIEERKWLVNLESGASVEVDRQMAFVGDDQVALFQYNFDFYLYAEHGTYDFRIVDLSGQEQVSYEYDGKFAYVDGNKNEDTVDFTDSFVIGSYSTKPWYYVNTHAMEETVELKYTNDKWTLNVLESPLKYVTDEEIVVYSEFLNFDSVLGSYMVSECKDIQFMNAYDIIDNQYVLWFEVTLSDDTKSYAYRQRRSYEKDNHLATIEMSLVKDDGTLYHLETYYDYMQSSYYLEEGLEALDTYIIATFLDGKNSRIIPKDGTEEYGYYLTNILKIKDSDKRIIWESGYYDEYADLSIHRIEDNKLIEEYQMPVGDYSVVNLEIVSDELITFTIVRREKKYPSSLKFAEGEWQIDTTYEFKNTN